MTQKLLNVWQTGCFTDAEICEHLSVSHYDLRKTLVAHGKALSSGLSIDIKRELKMMYDHAEVDYEDAHNLAVELACAELSIKKAMLGDYHQDTVEARNDAIKAELAKHTPQKVIAEMFGVSQATVSKLNPKPIKRPRGARMREQDWEELFSQYPRFNVTELAQMYGISRARIYGRMNKNGH